MINTQSTTFVLASGSPRRQQLLQQLGVAFDIVSADIDESTQQGEAALAYVQRVAREKCLAVQSMADYSEKTILGADTSVVLDGTILGKPATKQDSVDMLMALSNRWHSVITAVCVVAPQREAQIVVTSQVEFISLTPDMCLEYWQTSEPKDKAGSYAIQGIGTRFVRQIQGSYSAIVGLPVAETAELLLDFDIPIWNFDK